MQDSGGLRASAVLKHLQRSSTALQTHFDQGGDLPPWLASRLLAAANELAIIVQVMQSTGAQPDKNKHRPVIKRRSRT